MTTKITINVSGNRLLQQSREAQAANRQQLTQKEVDDKFVANVRQIEAATPPQRDGAVPEYRIQEQTSAQRGGLSFGWVYESYEDIKEQQYVAENVVDGVVSNKYRVAVGSGNGASWKYAEAEVEVPLNARDGVLGTAVGPIYSANTTLEIALPPVFGGNLYQECEGVFPTLEVRRTYGSTDTYIADQPMVGSFILPISAQQCVLVGSIVVRWRVIREYTGGTTALVLPEGYISDTGVIYGPPGTKTYLTAGGVPITIEDTARCAWVRPTNFTGLFPPGPVNTVVSSGVERTNFSFLISANKVTKLQITDTLSARLEAIFPTPQISGTSWNPNFWQDTSFAALGVSFNVTTNTWGPVIAGAPSIFDILDNNNNFSLYANTSVSSKGTSAYASVVPRYSPDLILDPDDPLDKEISSIYSAFYFGRKINSTVTVPPVPPSLFGEEAKLSEFIYLTPAERSASDYYANSSAESKLLFDQKLVPNPPFTFMTVRQPPDGIYRNDQFAQLIWNPTTGFNRDRSAVTLSAARVLPPALFSPELTPHPMIKKQRTFFIEPAGFETAAAYSRFQFKTLFWSAWNRNWQGKLLQLGVSFAVAP